MSSNIQSWKHSSDEVLTALGTTSKGLDLREAKRRLFRYGPNKLAMELKRTWFAILVSQVKNPLVLILLIASILSGFLGEATGTTMIVAMIFLSALMGFIQEYKSEKTLADLRKMVAHRTTVVRTREKQEINSSDLVLGDIVALSIGDIIPADLRLIEAHDLLLDEAALTGESFPVEKDTAALDIEKPTMQDLKNMAFMGTHLVGGSCLAVVVATGSDTELGKTGKYLKAREEETEFQKGIKSFGNFLVRIILYLVIFIFAVNAVFKHELIESLLFALALAVGITPELLPIIITINLSRGARVMAKKQAIVKRLMSIEDVGNADILCTDKTGTLTEGKIFLADYFDLKNKQNDKILLYSLLCNSAVVNKEIAGTPLDTASWAYAKTNNYSLEDFKKYKRVDELIFDFKRRMMSVVVVENGKHLMITKGATEAVMRVCDNVEIDGQKKKIKDYRNEIVKKFNDLSSQGFRLLAVAKKEIETKKDYIFADEKGLTLLGFLTFIDKPKETAKTALKTLASLGVNVKILTGDNAMVTTHICKELDFKINKIVTGEEIERMSDSDFARVVEEANVFVKITPEHKLEIIKILRDRTHTVAFLGDGINDAPALKAADVGISVDTAVDVAREAADIILLRKSLSVISEAVRIGRETFGNTIKYILNTVSANYGNMLSVAGASLFLPFLPLLPPQIILNNFISDIPNLSIATDKVDPEYLKKPKHWNIQAIKRFMIFFGLVSSVFDFLTFALLLFALKANIGLFRTGWFIESALSEIVVVFAIRTRRSFFKSRPSALLVVTSLLTIVFTVIIAYLPWGQKFFGFTPPSMRALGFIFVILAAYFGLVEFLKRYYYRKFEI